MPVPDSTMVIASKFQKALKNSDHSEIKAIPLEELREAKHHLIIDKDCSYYSLLVDTIEDIQEAKRTFSVPTFQMGESYVAAARIETLRNVSTPAYDLQKLIRLCEEVNIASANGCYYATAILVRAIVDHVPPIFGFRTFHEVANNYNGSKSFKELIKKFETTLRHLADGYLHEQVRLEEQLPTSVSVDFRQELDKLLEEVCRILVKS